MNTKDIFGELARAITQVFNKVYCRDIDSLLKKIEESNIDLTPNEKQALVYLTRDLRDLKSKSNRKEKFGLY